uniref:FRAS1-related extracellular matrix protein N-terminal domain-containing protein n=1 Tax=Gopherus evgoodei TaxID=1825980 RepID=A0A8C4YTM9_9SAUR
INSISFLKLDILIFLVHLGHGEAAKLLVNKDISVERGRVVYVTDKELYFNVSKERNPCKVEVVLNEPDTQRMGKLTPQVKRFDSHFLPSEVKYIHNGCPLLEEGHTIVETYVLHVEIRNPTSNITQFGKSSLDIPEIMSSETSLPAFGQIVAEHPIGVEIPLSPDKDYILIQVEIRDKNSQCPLQTENVWIPVGIKGAIPNTQAQAAFISMFILEIDQFILTPLTTTVLDAEAGEIPKDRLVFSITKCPLEGYITRAGGKGFKFTVKDLKDGVVGFQHDDSDATKDYAIFRIFDGRHKFLINILPKDDSASFLVSNIVFQLAEGETVLIEKHMLMLSDFDPSDDYIICKVTKPPRAGEIIKTHFPGIPVSTFLQRDVFHGLIYYHRLGGEIFQDLFDFILSDNQLPEEVPGTTRQLVVKETEIAHVTKNHLHFTDTKSPENQLMYMVTKSCFSPSSPGMESYKKDPAISMLTSFTQHAVTHLKLAYMPPERERFSVSDQQGRVVAGLNFNIAVMPVDDEAPEIFTNHLTEEGASFFISWENLMVSDLDIRDDLRIQLKICPQYGHIELYGLIMQEGDMFTLEDLQSYEIIPVNDKTPELQAGLKSRLECLEGGHVITTEYLYATDADSDDTKLTISILCFFLGGEIGHSLCDDNLTLIVSDGEAGTVDSCCFNKALSPPLSLHTLSQIMLTCLFSGHMFVVDEGSAICISLEYLNASDKDTVSEELTFFLETNSQYGYLKDTLPSPCYEKNNAGININDLQSLWAGYINYVLSKNECSEPTANRFMLPVCNDLRKSTVMPFYVVINPVNDEILDLQFGNITVTCELGPGTLNAEDLDVPHNAMSFSVFFPSPSRLPIGLMLVYMHDDTESLEDSFTIQLTDGKHTVQGTLYIYIMPVNDEIPHLSRLAI